MADVWKHSEFPFPNYDEFKNSCSDGRSQAVANIGTVGQWLDGRWEIKPPLSVLIQHNVFKYAHLLLNLQVVLYGILTGNNLVFGVVPLTIFVRIALSPSTPQPNRLLRLLLMFMLVGGELWALTSHDLDRSLIMSVLILSWLAQKCGFELAARSFFEILFKNEDFCRAAWLHDSISLRYADQSQGIDSAQSQPDTTSAAAPRVEVIATLDAHQRTQIIIQGLPASLSTSPGEQFDEADSNSESKRKIEMRAMTIALQYEKQQGRTPEDVSMYYTGYDIKSVNLDHSLARAIEVKGKSREGPVLVTSNEWKTAAALGEQYFLYIVEDVFSKTPRLKIIKHPYQKLQPKVQRLQYIMSRRNYIARATASIDIRQ